MNGRVSVKVVNSGLFRGKNKNGKVESKILKYFWSTWHYYTFFSYIFSENRFTRFIESSHPFYILKVKKLWNFGFLGCFCKAKTEERDQKIWSFSDKFEIIMPGSDTYFLEVSAHVSLKIATDDSLRNKGTL